MVVLSKKIESQFDILFSLVVVLLLQKFYFFLGGPKETSPPYSQGSIFSSSRSSSTTLYTFLSKSAIEKMEETMIKCCI